MNYIEFSKKIKSKYPQYSGMSDLDLATRMVKKYPEYADTVNFTDQNGLQSDIAQAPKRYDISFLKDVNSDFERFPGEKEGPKNFVSNLTPKDLLKGALNIAPYAAAPIAASTGPFAPAVLAGVSGLSRAGVGLLEGESTGTALKKGAIAAATDIAAGKALKAAGPVLKAGKDFFSESLKKTAPVILETTTSVPSESIEKAIKNPAILDTRDDLVSLGRKARKALEYLGRKSKKIKSKELKLLKDYPGEIDLSKPALEAVDKALTTSGGIPNYTNKEIEDVLEIASMLETEKTASGINQIVEIIRSRKNLYERPFSVDRTPSGEKLLIKLDQSAIKKLKEVVEGFTDTRATNKEAVEITKALGPYLRPNKDTSRIFGITNQEFRDHLSRLDELVPSRLKFLDRAENVKIRKQFDELFPGRQGGSGSAQGYGNLARLLGVSQTGLATAPLFSPLVTKKLIQALPKVQRGASALGSLLKPGIQRTIPRVVTPIDTQEDFRPQRRSLEEIKRERGL